MNDKEFNKILEHAYKVSTPLDKIRLNTFMILINQKKYFLQTVYIISCLFMLSLVPFFRYTYLFVMVMFAFLLITVFLGLSLIYRMEMSKKWILEGLKNLDCNKRKK